MIAGRGVPVIAVLSELEEGTQTPPRFASAVLTGPARYRLLALPCKPPPPILSLNPRHHYPRREGELDYAALRYHKLGKDDSDTECELGPPCLAGVVRDHRGHPIRVRVRVQDHRGRARAHHVVSLYVYIGNPVSPRTHLEGPKPLLSPWEVFQLGT